MLEALEGAEKYIFMEFFIIEPGVMWDSILDVLKRKAAAGVDVRLIYDDMACIMRLPRDYPQEMARFGIRCCTFHRFQPIPTGTLNNRDHRKICCVDGVTAFTGGVNLADEYINRRERFGHWLDCGVRVRGRAAYAFAQMFLGMWDYIMKQNEDPARLPARAGEARGHSRRRLRPALLRLPPPTTRPSARRCTSTWVSRAKDYVYICTPYLVVDNEIMNALRERRPSAAWTCA